MSDFLNVAGDWIYYQNISDNCTIYRIKTDGSEKQRLSGDMSEGDFIQYISVVGDWVYYTTILLPEVAGLVK